MAKILVFNNDTDRMETYYRGEAEPMPYNTNGTLRVREFRGTSKSNITKGKRIAYDFVYIKTI